jgi:cardiolipin synthase (CMP-forming)
VRITANQITILRILALPFPTWALVVRPEQPWMWIAFVIGTLVGATDFVDGWLARKHGPTILGALLDPVADKLFIAMLLLPCVAHGECPGWAAGLLISRELLITALRTSLCVRKESLKTSQLGKLKTVVQMGGIAAFYLAIFVEQPTMAWVQLACAFGMLITAFIFAFRNRGLPPTWLLGGTPLWFAVAGLAFFMDGQEVAFWIFIAMVVLTWVSAADYLYGAGRRILAAGMKSSDIMRIVWSIVHGAALIPLLGEFPALTVPVIISVCAELAYGGIDNGVAAEEARFAAGSVLPSTFAAIGVAILAWGGYVGGATLLTLAWVLAGISVINAGVAFYRDRKIFFAAAQS